MKNHRSSPLQWAIMTDSDMGCLGADPKSAVTNHVMMSKSLCICLLGFTSSK